MGTSREDILFHIMKDNVVPKAEDMRKKYRYSIDVTKLRTKIINYQIDKYGMQLDHNIDKIDLEKALENAKQRRIYRKNGKRK